MAIHDIQLLLSVAIQVVAVLPLVLFAIEFLSFARRFGGYEIPCGWEPPVSTLSGSASTISVALFPPVPKSIPRIAMDIA